jgi:predicted nucleotidyltransferase
MIRHLAADGQPGRPDPIVPGQTLSTCDPDIRGYVDRIVGTVETHLRDQLVGVYLHGSLAMGSFRPATSDVDVLVVVHQRLTSARRRDASEALAELAPTRPITGDLELSVIRRADAASPTHPMPYELHYSSSWTDRIRRGEVDYSGDKHDPDLAAHCTVTRARGVRLTGEPIASVFGPVPWRFYVDAVLGDLDWVLEGERILAAPRYGVLNSCRVLMLLSEGEGTIVNKEEGARWALDRIPPEHRTLVERALASYRSVAPAPADRPDSDGVDRDALLAWRDYMAAELAGARPRD